MLINASRLWARFSVGPWGLKASLTITTEKWHGHPKHADPVSNSNCGPKGDQWTLTFCCFRYFYFLLLSFWRSWPISFETGGFHFFLNYLSIFVCAGSLVLCRLLSSFGMQASHWGGFSCWGEQAVGAQASVVEARGLTSCGSRNLEHRLNSCGALA